MLTRLMSRKYNNFNEVFVFAPRYENRSELTA